MKISGLGHISPIGNGVHALKEALSEAPSEAPSPTSALISTPEGPVGVSYLRCHDFELPDSLPESVKRRMPRISALFFAAVFAAVDDAFGPESQVLRHSPQRIGIIVGTGFGCLSTAIAYDRRLIREGPLGASPTLFTGSIQNAIAAHLSIALGIQGPTSTVTTMEQTPLSSLRLAQDWLDQDVVDHVIVAFGDELSEIHLYAMASRPEQNSSGLLGEGVVAFLLSRDQTDLRRKPYAEIRGFRCTRELPPVERILHSPWNLAREEAIPAPLHRAGLAASSRTALISHANLYGRTVLGQAFELAVAACLVENDGRPSACIQLNQNEWVESILLAP